jgi:hypothetical protein
MKDLAMNPTPESNGTPCSYSASRTGKIARLPHEIRERLNQRLLDGEGGPEILDWLNSRAEVKKVLDERYESHPVTPGNLSEWRHGGYRDWLVIQEPCMRMIDKHFGIRRPPQPRKPRAAAGPVVSASSPAAGQSDPGKYDQIRPNRT